MAISKEIQFKLAKSYSKEGFSIGQISRKFNIPASTVVYYLDKHGIKRRPRNEAVTLWYITEFSKKPFCLKKNLSARDKKLKLAGVMLYWAEGAKGGNSVKFVNSDPKMVKIFIDFLRNICGISEDRLKLLIHLYPDQDDRSLKNFWSSATGIPESNFYKSYVHIGRVGTYKSKSLYGTVAVNYSDKKLLGKINFWIGEYKERF